jgi:hypothetical protein
LTTIEVLDHNRTAAIWQAYDYVRVNGVEYKARCKICNKLLAVGGNSTLVRHNSSCLSKVNTEEVQAQISNTGNIWQYDQQLQRDMQMKCVIQMGLPFNHFDNDVMTNYLQMGLQPKYQKVSRSTLRRDAVKAFIKAKKLLIGYFSTFDGKVGLTSDVWSAPHNLGMSYISITCHWIDPESWEMSKQIIAFSSFEYPHTGLAIYQVIMQCIRDFKIKDKIMSISFDNATNNTAAIEMLKRDLNPFLEGDFFHTRCVCHVINLIVQSGLEYVNPVVQKIRSMLIFIYSAPKRRQEFRKFCKAMEAKSYGSELDMPVRWNSTYKMLKRSVLQKNILMEFYNSNNPTHDLTYTDWDIIKSLTDILEVFYNATTLLSGVYYPTTPLVLGQFLLIALTFQNYKEHQFWSPLIYQMKQKYLKYYVEVPVIFSITAALNPAIGVEGVENILNAIYECLELDPTESIYKFNGKMTALYDHYDFIYGSRRNSSTPQLTSSSSSSLSIILQHARSKKQKSTSFNELVSYNKTDFDLQDAENINLLEWWKNKSSNSHYPIMAAMARDILTVQASTVASESAFSLSGRVLNERRCRLSPESLEICICYKDYLDGVSRTQHFNSPEEISDEVEEEIFIEELIEESYNENIPN